MNHLFQLFNVHGTSDVRQTKIHTEEQSVPQPSAFEIEMTIEKLKRHNHQLLKKSQQKWLRQGGRTIRSEIHTLINSIWNKDELSEEWKESIIVSFLRRLIK
jgi:hypothetical protein